ncbi:HNH endonuclease [Paenibacillus sp. FSL L8-0340]|uniref:HNH endonuclease n=1 Tax=Paenibacillus sp. FSL L8-0340 TaxID=2954685 RepID=UPI003158ADF7
MREIPLTQGKVALVDDEDYEELAIFHWLYDGRYAIRKVKGRSKEYMHRQLMPVHESGVVVDHVNGNPLDNRRSNLRAATFQQNAANSKIHAHNTSGYRGVSFYKRGKAKKWRAHITIDGLQHSLGYFVTAEEAAEAYNRKAIEVFKEFASLNVILKEAA